MTSSNASFFFFFLAILCHFCAGPKIWAEEASEGITCRRYDGQFASAPSTKSSKDAGHTLYNATNGPILSHREAKPQRQTALTSKERRSARFLWRQNKKSARKTTREDDKEKADGRRGRRMRHRMKNDISLWIDEKQVKSFSGYIMEIYVILYGIVLPYILDPDFEDHLPIIPAEVDNVNFTWRSGRKRYFYNFYLLSSSNKNILMKPTVSVAKSGKVPKKPKVFTVTILCTGNVSGVANFHIGLMIQNGGGVALPGTPITLTLKKKCSIAESPHASATATTDPSCDKKCSNGGFCNRDKRCRCPQGYLGQFCDTALCYPQCRNGGTCAAPGRCKCSSGYHGRYCEGGICKEKCLNGGKCVQKDTCSCKKGYYGIRCEFSKCVIPCVNDGKCRGVNQCRCKPGFSGRHCEIITTGGLHRILNRCNGRCRHGTCSAHGKCVCRSGYSGKWCRRRKNSRKRKNGRRKLWL